MIIRQKRCEASPGPVGGDEDVAYGLYSPQLFDRANGRLTPEAIQLEKLKGPHKDVCGHSSGISVCRLLSPQSSDKLIMILKQITDRNPERQIEGYAIANVDQIWKISEKSGMLAALDVLDDGREDYRDHAVVRGAAGLGRGALRGARNDLVELLNRTIVREIA